MAEHANLASRPSGGLLIAPAWHTIVLIAIFMALSVVGGFFQHAAKQHPQPTVPSSSAVPGYVSVLVSETRLNQLLAFSSIRSTLFFKASMFMSADFPLSAMFHLFATLRVTNIPLL
jgi:hypothetical protein